MEDNEEESDVHYAVDVIEQQNRFGIIGSRGSFKALSNFKVEYLTEVSAGTQSGFICSATFYNGNNLG